jgi:hypothetical protein
MLLESEYGVGFGQVGEPRFVFDAKPIQKIDWLCAPTHLNIVFLLCAALCVLLIVWFYYANDH